MFLHPADGCYGNHAETLRHVHVTGWYVSAAVGVSLPFLSLWRSFYGVLVASSEEGDIIAISYVHTHSTTIRQALSFSLLVCVLKYLCRYYVSAYVQPKGINKNACLP